MNMFKPIITVILLTVTNFGHVILLGAGVDGRSVARTTIRYITDLGQRIVDNVDTGVTELLRR